MIDAQSMTIQKLSVSVCRTGGSDEEIPWPYEHVPRAGERFSFGQGVIYVVREVQYNFVDGGGFQAVVMIDPAPSIS